jgi:two-component system cell cycle response regulator
MPNSPSLNILIVDDDPISMAILREHLAAAGHDVLCADSAAGAMYTLERLPIHIVIADWVMPEVSGLDLCRWVHSRALARIPHFVMLTVLSDKARLVEAFDAGADDFLSKPFHEAEFIARLRAWTRLVNLQDQLCARNEDAQRLTTQLLEVNRKLADLATRDELTGLPNRRQADRRLAEQIALAQRHGQAFSVALLDIDHFKQFNDSFGHLTGDEVLKHVASVLSRSVRASDTVFRIGGDEFLVIFPLQQHRDGAAWSERFQQELAEVPLVYKDHALSIACSVGLAEYSAAQENSAALLEVADRALYAAKNKREPMSFAGPPDILLQSEDDGNRTRNHRIDSPVL